MAKNARDPSGVLHAIHDHALGLALDVVNDLATSRAAYLETTARSPYTWHFARSRGY